MAGTDGYPLGTLMVPVLVCASVDGLRRGVYSSRVPRDIPAPAADDVIRHCGVCYGKVWLAPAQQDVLRRRADADICCFDCLKG